MMTDLSLRRPANEMICSKCSGALIAPEWSYDFVEGGTVIDLWSCMNCGNQFETEASAIDTSDNRVFGEALRAAA